MSCWWSFCRSERWRKGVLCVIMRQHHTMSAIQRMIEMTATSVTLQLPEHLFMRLQHAAQGMRQPLDEVLVRAVEVGSPPMWDDVPAAFQADLAALDRLDDESLWRVAGSTQTGLDWKHYQTLLDKNADGSLTADERIELADLRTEADRFMLRKAHAAALLRWRGHQIPPARLL